MKARHALLYAALLGLAGWGLSAYGRSSDDPRQQTGANPAPDLLQPIPARRAMARGLTNPRAPVTVAVDGKNALPIDARGVVWRVRAGQQ